MKKDKKLWDDDQLTTPIFDIGSIVDGKISLHKDIKIIKDGVEVVIDHRTEENSSIIER